MPHAETESTVDRDQRIRMVWYDSSAFLPVVAVDLQCNHHSIGQSAEAFFRVYLSTVICAEVMGRATRGKMLSALRYIRAPGEGLASMGRNIQSHRQSKFPRHPNTINCLSNMPRLVLFINICLCSGEHCTLI